MRIKSFKLFESDKVERARNFAKKAHAGVYRRGLNSKGHRIEYFIHPESVAKIVKRLKKSHKIAHLISAAYLHDVVEDTDITIHEIKKEFGELVASLVSELTSDKEQIELLGKEEYLTQKLLTMSSWGLIIKLADRLHNVKDIPDIMKNGSESRKHWAIKQANQTRKILEKLKTDRNLSIPQATCIKLIENEIKKAI